MRFIIHPNALILPISVVKSIKIVKEINAPEAFFSLKIVSLFLCTAKCCYETAYKKKAIELGGGCGF